MSFRQPLIPPSKDVPNYLTTAQKSALAEDKAVVIVIPSSPKATSQGKNDVVAQSDIDSAENFKKALKIFYDKSRTPPYNHRHIDILCNLLTVLSGRQLHSGDTDFNYVIDNLIDLTDLNNNNDKINAIAEFHRSVDEASKYTKCQKAEKVLGALLIATLPFLATRSMVLSSGTETPETATEIASGVAGAIGLLSGLWLFKPTHAQKIATEAKEETATFRNAKKI